ncbi:hypothetical protein ACQJBY_066473 [Aegilops geniculata]
MFCASQSPVPSVVCVLARKNSGPQLRLEDRERVAGPPLILSSPNRISIARNLSSSPFMANGRAGRRSCLMGFGDRTRSWAPMFLLQLPVTGAATIDQIFTTAPRTTSSPARPSGQSCGRSPCGRPRSWRRPSPTPSSCCRSLRVATAPSSASHRPPIAYPTRSMLCGVAFHRSDHCPRVRPPEHPSAVRLLPLQPRVRGTWARGRPTAWVSYARSSACLVGVVEHVIPPAT